MTTKLPSMQFYPGDWMKDPALRAVSSVSRGLCIDMLCLMWESSRRGFLVHSTGRSVSTEQLARMTGNSVNETAVMLQELEDCGVFSRTEDGILYSRRMNRDERERQAAAQRKRDERSRNSLSDVTPNVTAMSRNGHAPSSSSPSGESAHARTHVQAREGNQSASVAQLTETQRDLARVCQIHPDTMTALQFDKLQTAATKLERARGYKTDCLQAFPDWWEQKGKKAVIQPEYVLENFGAYLTDLKGGRIKR